MAWRWQRRGERDSWVPKYPPSLFCEMGDARPGALEPLSRAVIKSRGLRGSKNEVQMRGGFEARAEVPGGGRGGGEGSLEHPRISPGLGRRSEPGDAGLGGTLGRGGRRAPWECARGVTEPPPTRLAPWHSAALFTRSAFFFFFWSFGCRAELLRFNNWETGRGRWQTVP